MKVRVDAATCIGCTLCETVCPEIFTMNDGIAVAQTIEVPEEALVRCKESIEGCPVQAIHTL